MKTLGGFTMIRNGKILDYAYDLAILSMLPICDSVVVSDCESSDGTREHLNEWAKSEPKLKVVDYPWTDPKGDSAWYPGWINATREHLKTDFVFYLDGDELLDPASYPLVIECVESGTVAMCSRLNFFRDAQHLIPHHECCGFEVIRLGPQRMFFPSDYPDPRSTEIEGLAKRVPIQIFHYGFLRERAAFFRKAREIQRIWSNSFDPRLKEAEEAGGNWMEHDGVVPWKDRLEVFEGSHPALALPWLRSRGYSV